MTSSLDPYDGILLLSFGGPEGPDDVMPFLRRVTAGRGIPDERLEEVGSHYHRFGGRSPINDQNRALIRALQGELGRREIEVPVLWANRNFEPLVADALADAGERRLTRLVTVVTSAYSSYSSCRQYREDLAAGLAEAIDRGGDVASHLRDVLRIDKVRPYAHHPAFSATNSRLVTEAVRDVIRTGAVPHVLFVTHSVPTAMDETSGPGDGEGRLYSQQHARLAAAIVEEARATLDTLMTGELSGPLEGEVVYCSRSGPAQQPWLEPDVCDRLEELAGEGVTHVVLAPIGFVSDHMEVAYDLDTEAAAVAEKVGLTLVRVPTVGTDSQFVSGVVDLLEERAAEARGEPVEHVVWPSGDARPAVCDPGCCPNLRVAAPALCGRD